MSLKRLIGAASKTQVDGLDDETVKVLRESDMKVSPNVKKKKVFQSIQIM